MKIFLFYVNTIVGLDDWTDRKLICPVQAMTETSDKLYLSISIEDPAEFRKLIPTKSYALQFEYEDDRKELKYYSLNAFEIMPPPKGDEIYEVILHVSKIQ